MSGSPTRVLLTASDISFHISDRKILENITFSIHEGEKIGLIGRNGSGKTTLLKIIAELEKPDSGKIEKRRDIKISYLSQSIEKSTQIASSSGSPDSKIQSLSGGESRKLALREALNLNPDLLILDEPTNHLDTSSIEWLQEYLKNYKGACIFVTHDRYFLDEIATRILEISNSKIYSHSGNYSEYLIVKANREANDEFLEKDRQKFLKKELEWIARTPQGRTTKSKGRIQRYYEVAGKEKNFKDLDVDLIIPTPPGLSERILDIKHLSYSINGKTLFSDINIQFAKKMRLGIVGKNGSGKSTFLKTILGQIQPDSGSIDIASRTEINYSDQEKLVLDPEKTILEEIGENSDLVFIAGKTLSARAYLKRFLFTDHQLSTRVKYLSGGEKSRLILAKILKSGGNFLILDEPTNDLDLSTLRVLEEALIAFDGCVIVVSHDRYFLNRISTHILGFEHDGKTRFLAGDYDLYRKVREEAGDTEREVSGLGVDHLIHDNSIISPEANAENIQDISKKIDREKLREIEKTERRITKIEEEIKRRSDQFAEPEFYQKHTDKIPALTAEIKALKDELNELTRKWEELVG